MGRFTRIPETNLPGTLGGIVGQAAGTVIGTANTVLEKLQEKINLLSQKILEGKQDSSAELDQIEQTLDTLEGSILRVEQSAEGLNKTVTAVKVPVTALKIAVNIAKYLPLPSPVASVSVLQADIVQMLLELIAQIEQIILTLETIIKIILELLKKLKDLIDRLRKLLSVLRTNLSFQKNLTSSDRSVLEESDIPNILNQVVGTILSRTTDIIWIGNYRGIDTGSLIVENQVKSAESGTTISVSSKIPGSWNVYRYCVSEVQPKKPVSTELVPPGWKIGQEITGKSNIWQTKGTVSGELGKVVSWTQPKSCLKDNIRDIPARLSNTVDVNVFRYSVDLFKRSKFNLQEANAIILSNSEESYNLFLEVLQTVDNLPVSSELKIELQVEINPQENQSDLNNEVDYYVSTAGACYTLRLKTSSVSPKIATQRYVEVVDETGTIVYEGTRSFATNPQVLFEETKVRLTQLFG